MANQELPDMILMDINLPGMNGIEAVKTIRKIEKIADIPVVAITANAMTHDINKAMEAGFEGYITKPFKLNDIIEALSNHLGLPDKQGNLSL